MKNQNESRTKRQMIIACLVTVSLFITTKVSAQIPYRTITNGCEWSVSDEKYMTLGDTIINGVTYMKVYSQKSNQPFEFNPSDAHYFTAIRDDSVNKKVYCNMPAGTIIRNNSEIGQTEGPQEFLLYDYSLSMGETVTFYTLHIDINANYYAVNEGVATRVGSCGLLSGMLSGESQSGYDNNDTVVHLSDGTAHKVVPLVVDINYLHTADVWTEGIGSVWGFNNYFFDNEDYGERRLLCFTNAEGADLHTGLDLDNNPEDCYNREYMGGISDKENKVFAIYPNPASQSFVINFTEAQEGVKQVRIFDMLGKEVLSKENPSSNTINIATLPTGIYTVHILSQSGKGYTSKLVKE
jgi:hypothetical protein